MTDKHSTGKSTCRFIIQHIFVEFMAITMTHLMIYQCIIVHMLLLVGNDTSIAEALTTFTFEREIQTITVYTIMQCNDVMIHMTVSLLLYIYIAYAYIFGMSLFQTIQVQTGIIGYIGLYYLCSEEVTVICRMVTKQQFGFGTFF